MWVGRVHRTARWVRWAITLGAVAIIEVALSAEVERETPHLRPGVPPVAMPSKQVLDSKPLAGGLAPDAVKKASLLVIDVDIDTAAVDIEAMKKTVARGEQPSLPLLLSVDIPGVPLKRVLVELGRKLPAKVYLAEGMGNEPVTAKFRDLPLDQGIKQLLEGKSYLMVREKLPALKGRGDARETRISEIRVLGKDGSALPAAQLTELKEDPAALKDELAVLAKLARESADPKERIKAMQLFLDKADGSDEAGRVDVLMSGVKDSDPRVQKSALSLVSELNEVPPTIEPIEELALKANRPDMRSAALSAAITARGADATPLIEQALREDSDPVVRKAAEQGLVRIERVQAFLKRRAELQKKLGQ